MEEGLFSGLTSFLAWSLNITWVYTKRPHTPYFTYGGIINWMYRSADKSLARPTSQCILFDG
jgi:hypothetical protein